MDWDEDDRRERNTSKFPEIGNKPRPGSSKPVEIKTPKLYLHATKDEANLAPISRGGLKAGASQGIGDPDTQKPFPNQVFVAKRPAMKFVSQEASGGNIGVISGTSPDPDYNYKGGRLTFGDAGSFYRETIRPLRDVQQGSEIGREPFSFTFPMTPRTASGAKKVLEHLNPGKTFTPGEAKQTLTDAFKREFTPLYIESSPPASPRGRSRTRDDSSRESSPARSRSRSRSPSPNRSRSSSFEMGGAFAAFRFDEEQAEQSGSPSRSNRNDSPSFRPLSFGSSPTQQPSPTQPAPQLHTTTTTPRIAPPTPVIGFTIPTPTPSANPSIPSTSTLRFEKADISRNSPPRTSGLSEDVKRFFSNQGPRKPQDNK
ncbi:MAG: hypothetical protein ACJ8NR_13845 [Sulfurifustis sp.]